MNLLIQNCSSLQNKENDLQIYKKILIAIQYVYKSDQNQEAFLFICSVDQDKNYDPASLRTVESVMHVIAECTQCSNKSAEKCCINLQMIKCSNLDPGKFDGTIDICSIDIHSVDIHR